MHRYTLSVKMTLQFNFSINKLIYWSCFEVVINEKPTEYSINEYCDAENLKAALLSPMNV